MSALTLGIAFSGMSMVIGYMSNAVSPASEALAKIRESVCLHLILGGQVQQASHGRGVMLLYFCSNDWGQFCTVTFNWTKTLNVDMWNVWGKL